MLKTIDLIVKFFQKISSLMFGTIRDQFETEKFCQNRKKTVLWPVFHRDIIMYYSQKTEAFIS